MTPRLACFDLDNTLIDRDRAFRDWAHWWVGSQRLDPSAVDWLLAHDEGGFNPREKLFAGLREEYGLRVSVEELVAAYDREHPGFTTVEPEVLAGLASLRAARWRVAVVTNGGVVQQSLKLEHTGIGAAVDHSCISEAAGVRKPDPRIFAIAAERAGAALASGWMAGDHPAYDIAGGRNAGLATILVGNHHPEAVTPERTPSHHVRTILEAFELILRS